MAGTGRLITDASKVPLSARAWTGNGRFGALVSADGTMDWYCPTGIGGVPTLWRLLDHAGGAIRVGPERGGSGAARRLPPGSIRYVPGTNVVETVLEAAGGRRVSVLDLFEWPGPGLDVSARAVRIVRALSGPVDVEVEVYPSGALRPSGVQPTAKQVVGTTNGVIVDDTAFRTGFPLAPEPLDRDTPRWRAVRRLQEGEGFVVTVESRLEGEHPLTLEAALRAAEVTGSAWRSWASRLTYSGGYKEAVERSLLALRCLTGPGGAPVSAATTSLPRRLGSERNSDCRSVRWQVVASAVSTLAAAGFAEDAEAAEAWLRRAVTEAPLPWPAWLDPDGQAVPTVEEVSLAGWRGSQPVVTGVAADLVDIDAYGAVVGAVGASTTGPGGKRGDPGELSAAWPALTAATDWLTDNWPTQDAGVWLHEGPPAQLVSSRLQAWFALDRMARLARAANPLDLAAVVWQQEARSVLRWIEDAGIAADGGLRRDGSPDAGDEPDAALLRVTWRGPWPTGHPVVHATVDRILERLSSGGLLYRYPGNIDDGKAGPDNPDLLASLWAVKALARLKRWEEAHERIETVLGFAGAPGLLSETADPLALELTGNLPSSPVHLALVDAAFELSKGPV